MTYVGMLGTYPIAGIHETVRYWYLTYVQYHENANYNQCQVSYSRYTRNCQVLKCRLHEL